MEGIIDKVKDVLGLGQDKAEADDQKQTGAAASKAQTARETTTTTNAPSASAGAAVSGAGPSSTTASSSSDATAAAGTAPTSASSPSEGPNDATGQVGLPLPGTSSSTSTSTSAPEASSATAASAASDAARAAAAPAPASGPSGATTGSTSSNGKTPAFDPAHITVVYVLGGPGAGKGTQCAKLIDEKDFVHLSAGDLLRAEQQREGSKVGQLIKEYIKEGTIVPMEVTIGLLKAAMQERIDKDGKHRFLIDGFPRQMDQAIEFDRTVVPGSAVLFLICPEDILLQRLLERGKTSGRDDDNAESIKKRFRTFIETSMPVVDYYRKLGKVIDINSSKSIDEVYSDISVALDSLQRRKSMSLEAGTRAEAAALST